METTGGTMYSVMLCVFVRAFAIIARNEWTERGRHVRAGTCPGADKKWLGINGNETE